MFFRVLTSWLLSLSMVVPTAVYGAEPVVGDRQAGAPTGIELLGARCFLCHGPMVMLAFTRKVLDDGGAEALDTMLITHHAPDAEAREEIVRYLSLQSGY